MKVENKVKEGEMRTRMTEAEHYQKHRELHKWLDELVADWIQSTGNRPSEYTVLALMQWSAIQFQNIGREGRGEASDTDTNNRRQR